jgi:hypothetical protein
MRLVRRLDPRQRTALAALAAVAVLGACADSPKRDDEAGRNTFACALSGERLVVRFDGDEARLLMPGGERVVLYQVPTGSGIRFTNGTLDLRGKGMDLQLIRNGVSTPLADCQPYAAPK